MATDTLSKLAGTSSRRKITPPQYARQLGVDKAKVIAWIRSGELRAIDASTHRGTKPRFLIDVADIEAFEQDREVLPACPPPRVRRNRRSTVKQYV